MLRQKHDHLLGHLSTYHEHWTVQEEYVLHVEREHLLASSFSALREIAICDLLADNLRVEFSGELGQDEGGVLRDWFDSVGRQLFKEAEHGAPPLLREGSGHEAAAERVPLPLLQRQVCDETVVLRPDTGRFEDFYTLGRFLALAVIRGTRVPLHFSRAAWKLLIGAPIEAADVYAIDPVFFTNRIAAVLEPGGIATVSDLLGEPLTFMSAESPLCPEPMEMVPGGGTRLVTEENRVEYVEKLCEFYICGNVGREWRLVKEGFEELLPYEALRVSEIAFRDIELLVAGLPCIDVDDWRKNAVVDGPLAKAEAGERLQTWFWEVVDQFGVERRAKLLQFATGSSRVPAAGFAGLDPAFCLYLGSGSPKQVPTASTCANQLNLAAYTSRWELIEKLKIACHEGVEGFGLL